MGAWGSGPFDNDTAADWCGTLQDAEPDDRAGIIRNALAAVVESDGYLDNDEACEAIAAAAIVASTLRPGNADTSPCAAESLSYDYDQPLPDDLPAVAVQALDRVMADESEWRELWADASEDGIGAFEAVDTLRSILRG